MDTKLNWRCHLQISIKQCQIIVGKSGFASFCCGTMDRDIQLHQLRCDQQLPSNHGYFQLASFPTIFWWAWSNQSYPKNLSHVLNHLQLVQKWLRQPKATQALRCVISFFRWHHAVIGDLPAAQCCWQLPQHLKGLFVANEQILMMMDVCCSVFGN